MSESVWDFYNNSPNPVRQACVAEWKRWLAEVSVTGERQRLERYLKSAQDAEHFSARLELYFHHHFTAQQVGLDIHPPLNDTAERPDFLVHHGSGDFYLEATIRHGERSFVEMKTFADYLENELASICSPHTVSVSIEEPCPAKAMVPKITEFLKEELLSFAEGNEDEREVVWEESVHKLWFSLHRRSGASQPLVVSTIVGGISRIADDLYDSIANKARKYGGLSRPLVIAVWGLSYTEQYDEENALYGTLGIAWERDRQGNAVAESFRDVRQPNWVFTLVEGGQLKNRKVSAVVFYQHRLGAYEYQHLLRVYHNPYALNPLPQDIFGSYPQRVPREVDDHIELHWLNEPADES